MWLLPTYFGYSVDVKQLVSGSLYVVMLCMYYHQLLKLFTNQEFSLYTLEYLKLLRLFD